jgi:tetratricopeptide (TPR) repeat protein
MQERSHRQQLKKDALAELVLASAEWIKNNRSLFLTIAGTVLGVIFLVAFFFTRFHATRVVANEKLAVAQGQLYSGQPAQGMQLLDDIINRYSQSPVAFKARLTKADFLLVQQNYAEAEKTLLPVTEKGKPASIIPLAFSLLGTAQEDAGKYNDAIKAYTTFLDRYPDHFLAPKMYESLGRVYELTGARDEARATYEKLITLYPATGWSQRAQERLTALTPKPNP